MTIQPRKYKKDNIKTFRVTIEATVRKTIEVDAENQDEAVEQAHQEFSTENTDDAEKYTEDMVEVEEVRDLETFGDGEDE